MAPDNNCRVPFILTVSLVNLIGFYLTVTMIFPG